MPDNHGRTCPCGDCQQMLADEWIADAAYDAWIEAEYARLTDEAVAFRRHEEALLAQVDPVPGENEVPF